MHAIKINKLIKWKNYFEPRVVYSRYAFYKKQFYHQDAQKCYIPIQFPGSLKYTNVETQRVTLSPIWN